MFNKVLRTAPVLAIVAVMVISLVPAGFAMAGDSSISITAQYQSDGLVVLDTSGASEVSSLDPQVASDSVSITWIENLFHGLTDYDPVTSQVVPELATSWEASEDGLTWTFNMRDDVMWYRYDPATETAEQLRPVVAGDVVYGVQRACDPRLHSTYGLIISTVIAGCDEVIGAPESEATDEFVFGDTVKVSAPDDTTVVFELQFAAGYFFSMTPMWVMRPVHKETLDEFGDEWTAPGNIATNGPYFVSEVTRGVRRVAVRNNNHLEDLDYGGNIDVISVTIIEDGGTVFALYQDNQLDSSTVPTAELQNILEDPEYADELLQIFDLVVFYFGFAHDKEPFDNAAARRAFSAIVDRQAFVEQIRQGRGVPMIHFTPPGMSHAPPINEVGVGFDPEFAVAQLAEAGYENCEGFPAIDIVTYQGAGTWAEFWVSAAEEFLGCSPDLFTVEQLEFSVLLEITSRDAPTQDRPNAWTLAWGPDYADANNWVNDVLACDASNDYLRPCTETDDLIDQAARSSDPAERDALYREIEESFFGPEGESPIVPLYLRSAFSLAKTWYTGPFETELFGGIHWDAYNIDMDAKLAARG